MCTYDQKCGLYTFLLDEKIVILISKQNARTVQTEHKSITCFEWSSNKIIIISSVFLLLLSFFRSSSILSPATRYSCPRRLRFIVCAVASLNKSAFLLFNFVSYLFFSSFFQMLKSIIFEVRSRREHTTNEWEKRAILAHSNNTWDKLLYVFLCLSLTLFRWVVTTIVNFGNILRICCCCFSCEWKVFYRIYWLNFLFKFMRAHISFCCALFHSFSHTSTLVICTLKSPMLAHTANSYSTHSLLLHTRAKYLIREYASYNSISNTKPYSTRIWLIDCVCTGTRLALFFFASHFSGAEWVLCVTWRLNWISKNVE